MPFLSLFQKFARTGNWEQAAELVHQAMNAEPERSLWPFLGTQVLAKSGRFHEALACARHMDALPLSEEIDPSGAWTTLGLAAFLEQAYDIAVEALGQARTLDPANPDLTLHLALSLHSLGKCADALDAYQNVLTLEPACDQARYNAVQCLIDLGRLQEAERVLFRRAGNSASLSVTPSPASPAPSAPSEDKLAFGLVASALFEAQGRPEDALAVLPRPEELSPAAKEAEANLRIRRSALLFHLGRNDEALAEGRYAVACASCTPDIALKFENLLRTAGRAEEAARLAESVIQKYGATPLREGRRAFNIPLILEDSAHADRIRKTLNEFLNSPGPRFPIRPEEIMPLPPFYLAFHGRNDKELLAGAARFLEHRTSLGELAAEPVPLNKRLQALRDPGRRRIGFLSPYFGNHTLMSYFFRLLESLCPRFKDCLLLEYPQPDNAFRRDLARKARFVTLPTRDPRRLEESKEAIRQLDLDILIHLDLGMDLFTWLLAFTRPAKIQCSLYGHPATTGIPQVDFFLSPQVMEPDNAQAHYTELLRTFPGTFCGFMPPTPLGAPSPQLAGARGKIYLCAQSLFKIHPDMDAPLATILEADPDAGLYFFASPHEEQTAALARRFEKSLGKHAGRVHWLRQCPAEEFDALLNQADAVLDSLHFSGGATSFKSLGLGVPVITHQGEFMRGRQTAGLYRHLQVEGLIAHNLEEYAALALNLAHDKKWRTQKQAELQEKSPALFDADASAQALEVFLNEEDMRPS